jgi:peptidoglycan/LPS O-acetylase OafA/YrhL
MSWLIAQTWVLLLVAFVLGSAAAWTLHRLVRTPGRQARR